MARKTTVVIIHKFFPIRIFVEIIFATSESATNDSFTNTCTGRERTSSISVCAHSIPDNASESYFKPLICCATYSNLKKKPWILSILYSRFPFDGHNNQQILWHAVIGQLVLIMKHSIFTLKMELNTKNNSDNFTLWVA